MKELEEGKIITLNNNKDYVIVNIVKQNNDNYLNLLSTEEPAEMLILKIEDKYGMSILSEIDDEEELSKILEIIENN